MDEKMKQVLANHPSALDLSSLRYPKPTDVPVEDIVANAQENSYRSSRALLQRLAQTIAEWRTQLDDDAQPAILAILNGGIQVQVERMAQESFHGIRIEGLLNGSPCMLLSHQSSVQLLCYIERVKEKEFRRKIGFIIDGVETEA